MLRRLTAAVVACWLMVGPPAAAEPDPPLPHGSRVDGDRHASPLAFRATADWYVKLWRKRGLVVRTVGPYRVGGVDVIRYVRDDGGPWRAVHIYRSGAKTWIFVVPGPPEATGSPPPAATTRTAAQPLDGAGATE